MHSSGRVIITVALTADYPSSITNSLPYLGFPLHQIYDMMSHAMDAARGSSRVQKMKESFQDQYMKIKTAPAQGLCLDMGYYKY